MSRVKIIEVFNFDKNLIDCLKLLFYDRTKTLYSDYNKLFKNKDIEVLHQTRVSARRLQTLFKVFKSLFPQKRYNKIYFHLKQLIVILGPVREQDVLNNMLGEYLSQKDVSDVKALMLLYANLRSDNSYMRTVLLKKTEVLDFKMKENSFYNFYELFLSKSFRHKSEIFNPSYTFKENASLIFSLLIDRTLSYKDYVLDHPKSKTSLHRMRIKAKPLRYLMEIYVGAFKSEFKLLFEDVKSFVQTTGDIHDKDILLHRLRKFKKDIIYFNKLQKGRKETIPTKPIRNFIIELSRERHNEYIKICEQILRWDKENIKENFRELTK
jgi:CHAD domain-containing protein